MIAGKRFVIAGLSRLTTRVARVLAARGAVVTVIRGTEGEDLVPLLGEHVRVQQAGSDRASALHAADLAGSMALLALADNDLANLQVAVSARQIAPEAPAWRGSGPVPMPTMGRAGASGAICRAAPT